MELAAAEAGPLPLACGVFSSAVQAALRSARETAQQSDAVATILFLVIKNPYCLRTAIATAGLPAFGPRVALTNEYSC